MDYLYRLYLSKFELNDEFEYDEFDELDDVSFLDNDDNVDNLMMDENIFDE